MSKPVSRKFVSPSFSGEIVSEDNREFKEKSNRRKEKAMPRSLSDSQYEDIFTRVIEKSVCKSKDSCVVDDRAEEDNVAIPEPDAALSPGEEAEETNRDVFRHGSAAVTKTPKNPTDNSILPPLKKKKPESRIKKLGLKLKPTRLNFDDPELKGKPENVLKPPENDTFSERNSKKYKMPIITSNSRNIENEKSLPDKETSKPKTILSKNINGNKASFVNPFVSPKFQSQQTATCKGVNQKKISHCDRIIPSNYLSSVSNVGNLSPSQSTPKSFHFGSQESCSPGSEILSPRSRLFRLQKKRNVGLWVQCSNLVCSKWRYLANTRDPTEVPDNWQCYMNDDERYATCSAPERGPTPLEEEDLIHNIYTAGSLVWARLPGYPWWPAMVDDDPDVEQYYWITEYSDIPTHYNVSFFDDKPVTRAWLTCSALTKYTSNEKRKDLLKMTANGIDYSGRIKVAIEQANKAAKLTIAERLEKYSFVTRYKGPIGKKRQLPDSPEEIRKREKKSKREKEREISTSLGDSQTSILRSLEVVKEVNEVLSQMHDLESEDSEEDPQIDLNKSLEEVNEFNEVLNLLSDSESIGVDDDQLEEYLKSALEEPSTAQRSKEKLTSSHKKKFTKLSVDKDRDKHRKEKEKRHSDKEKKKHGMGLSFSLKKSKFDDEGSGFMSNKKAEREKKSTDINHEFKDSREKVHISDTSRKEKYGKGHSSGFKDSEKNLKRTDIHRNKTDEKHARAFKKEHETQKEAGRKNFEQGKSKVKHVLSDEAQKKVYSDSKKRESRSKERRGHADGAETKKKNGEGYKKEEESKEGESGNHHGKQKKEIGKGKSKSAEMAEGKSKMDMKNYDKGVKNSSNKNLSTSLHHVTSKGSPMLSKSLKLRPDKEDSGKEIIDGGLRKSAGVADEQQEKGRLKEAVENNKDLEKEENKGEEGEKVQEKGIERLSAYEEVTCGKGICEEEHSESKKAVDNEDGKASSLPSDGRLSVDIFKERDEEDAFSFTSQKSADFDFEE